MACDSSLERFRRLQDECYHIFESKNRDYGDSFRAHGVVGLIVRLHDKFLRFVSVSKNQVALVQSESLRDTLLDLANYALMAAMLLDEE